MARGLWWGLGDRGGEFFGGTYLVRIVLNPIVGLIVLHFQNRALNRNCKNTLFENYVDHQRVSSSIPGIVFRQNIFFSPVHEYGSQWQTR